MKFKSNNPFDAKKEILRIAYTSDYHYAGHKTSRYGAIYVYYSPERCRFSFDIDQRQNPTELIKRYKGIAPDMEEVLNIVATKYTLPQIMIGAINARKMMSHKDFFSVFSNHYSWA